MSTLTTERPIVAANTAAFARYGLEEAVCGVAAAGYGWIEVASIQGYGEHVPDAEMTPDKATQVRALLERHSLRTYSFAAHMTDILADGELEKFKQRMRFAKELGCSVVITNVSPRDRRARFMDCLNELAILADQLDLIIGLEAPGKLVVELTEYDEILSAMSGKKVLLNYDAGNLFTATKGSISAMTQVQHLLPAIVNMHLKDVRRTADIMNIVPVGAGEVGYRDILRHLTEHAGRCALTVEMPLHLEMVGDAPAKARPGILPWQEVVTALAASRRFVEESLTAGRPRQ